MADFKQIDEARKILGLGDCATFDEIKQAYRELSLKYHPDRCGDENKKGCEEKFKKISNANGILMGYCAGYRYSFKERDVKKNTMDKEFYDYLKRFYDGWWGDLDL